MLHLNTIACEGLKRAAIVSEAAVRNAPLFFLPGAFPHEGKNGGEAGMFPESSEGPSTGGAAPRSGAAKLLLCEGLRAYLQACPHLLHCLARGVRANAPH